MSDVITVEEKELKKAVKKHLSISHQNTLEQLLEDRNGLLCAFKTEDDEADAISAIEENADRE